MTTHIAPSFGNNWKLTRPRGEDLTPKIASRDLVAFRPHNLHIYLFIYIYIKGDWGELCANLLAKVIKP